MGMNGEKTVPFWAWSLVVGICMLGGGSWMTSLHLADRLGAQERKEMTRNQAELDKRLTVVESQLESIKKSVNKVEDKVDKTNDGIEDLKDILRDKDRHEP